MEANFRAARRAVTCLLAAWLPAAMGAEWITQEGDAAMRPEGWTHMDDAALDARRGGTLAHNDMRLDGQVASNSAAHLTTGANVIDAGSLVGNAGLPVVIQNSGNNVLIQNATIVNVQLR